MAKDKDNDELKKIYDALVSALPEKARGTNVIGAVALLFSGVLAQAPSDIRHNGLGSLYKTIFDCVLLDDKKEDSASLPQGFTANADKFSDAVLGLIDCYQHAGANLTDIANGLIAVWACVFRGGDNASIKTLVDHLVKSMPLLAKEIIDERKQEAEVADKAKRGVAALVAGLNKH
jgi:hypothetical protein